MSDARIAAIEYYLPETEITNAQLSAEHPEWSVDKIEAKTGIRTRKVAAADQCASDLAVRAAELLFASGACDRAAIDFVLLCTQSPDYFLPTTACVIQQRLGLPNTVGALDFNLGCSGFVYGLGLAKGLIETGQARNVLLLTAETYSKFLAASDRSVRTIFGDGAAATLVSAVSALSEPPIGPFVYGTDGSGAEHLIVPTGGARTPNPNGRPLGTLHMAGPEIYNFTMTAVPAAVEALLKKAGLTDHDIDLYVFHQANEHMLTNLRRRLSIPAERFCVELSDCGNTVSSTIPIALRRAAATGQLKDGDLVMLVGFGVGYSWAAALVRWSSAVTALSPPTGS
jgi:3-oxoacyl-[acyl-carrier-protein] synthase-3